MHRIDYSALDRPEILDYVFYPRKDFTGTPPGAHDYHIAVDEDVSISCRLHVLSAESPSVLYFHGNGEVVSDYDDIAPMYSGVGLNLFVADYRGYGASQGSPTLSNTVADSRVVFEAFAEILQREGYCIDIFVMGRSLGSLFAVEVAYCHKDRVKGLIIESGFAAFSSMLSHLGIPAEVLGVDDPEAPNLARVRAIEVPTLIIHGEQDQLIPVSEGEALFRGSAAAGKRLLIIPRADHNDIMWTGKEEYFRAIREFAIA